MASPRPPHHHHGRPGGFRHRAVTRLRAGLSATGERARHGEAAHRRADGGRAGEATLAGLRGALSLTAVALQVNGTPVDVSTPLDVAIGDSQLRIASARVTARGADIRVGGSLALTEDAPIDFSITGGSPWARSAAPMTISISTARSM